MDRCPVGAWLLLGFSSVSQSDGAQLREKMATFWRQLWCHLVRKTVFCLQPTSLVIDSAHNWAVYTLLWISIICQALGMKTGTQRQGTHRPRLQRTHNLMENTLSKQITSTLQTFAEHQSHAIKHHAGSWTRQYIIINCVTILHTSTYTAQMWTESITKEVGWGDKHSMPFSPNGTTVFRMLLCFLWGTLCLTDLRWKIPRGICLISKVSINSRYSQKMNQ